MAFVLPVATLYFFSLWYITGNLGNSLIICVGIFLTGFPILEYQERKRIRAEKFAQESLEKRKSREWMKTPENNYGKHLFELCQMNYQSLKKTEFLEKNGFLFEIYFLEHCSVPLKISEPFCPKCKGQLTFDEGKGCVCGKKCGFEKSTTQTISEIMKEAAIQFDIPLYPIDETHLISRSPSLLVGSTQNSPFPNEMLDKF